jgi:hypothetical protein
MITINGLDGQSPSQPKLDVSKPFIIESKEGTRLVVFMARIGAQDFRLICVNKNQDSAVFNRIFEDNMYAYIKNNAVEKFITDDNCKIIKSNIDITINVEIS